MADAQTTSARILMPDDQDELRSMDALAHAVVDDVLRNIIHDIVLRTHRDEKIDRARSAAVIVEQKAAELYPHSHNDDEEEDGDMPVRGRAETEGAIYEDGSIFLKGNPLVTTHEILCGKCGLPKLLHPTDGNGARKPDPTIEYCKRHPFIDRPGHDVHGQPFPVEGPGKGHKKKKEPVPETHDADGNPIEIKPATTFPNVKCHICQRFLNVRRFAKHLEQCLGIKSRASGRAAMLKMNGSGSTNGSTPPSSQRSTPLPTKRPSPSKRDADELEDDGESDESHRKKKLKKTILKIKAPKMARSSSQLSFEQKRDEDDISNLNSNSNSRSQSQTPIPKKKSTGVITKKWKSGRQTIDGKIKLPAPDRGSGTIRKVAKPLGGGSDSSHTLSSP